MKVKYVRYSSVGQTPDRQLINARDYDKIYVEQVSGCIPFAERIEGARLLADIQSGKVSTLCVEEISRCGRGVIDTLSTLQFCEKHNVNVVIENMGLCSRIENKPNPVFALVSSIIATIAAQERLCVAERMDAGRVAARMRGVTFGRKTNSCESRTAFLAKPNSKNILKYLQKENYTIREIAALTSTSTKLVMKVKKLING